DRLIRQRVELVEDEPAVRDPRAQIAQIADLLPAEAGRAQQSIVEACDAFGAQRLALRKERKKALKDRRRRFRRQLLTHDRADQRVEMIAALPRRHAARADP